VEQNAEQIRLDFRHLAPAPPLSAHPCVPAVVGPPELLHLQPGCRIDPLVVADTTNGPVVVGQGAVVAAFTRLEGPCWVGPGTHAGVFCNLLPSGRLLPKYVPSFCSWWDGSLTDNANLARLVQTAAKVMGRRGRACAEAEAVLFRLLYDQTAPERWRAVREC